jgi:hypothetical protein
MADALVIAEADEPDTGYRFSWGIAIAGGVVATAVTFILLTLGAGFGLLLTGHASHPGASPVFLAGGGIYFFVVQAFGFAVGGHLAGRLLGPLIETQREEDIRAGAHGFVSWAVAILITLAIMAFAGMTAATTGAATTALYGASASNDRLLSPTPYLVDKLFRPDGVRRMSPSDVYVDVAERAEATRGIDASLVHDQPLDPDDRERLVELVSDHTGISSHAAADRVDGFQVMVRREAHAAIDATRRAASYASLWIAFSLIFGAIVAVASAVFARIEDDRDAALVQRP